ncbi:MAG: hypothetical protein K6B46_06290 [Opitutales bacterium]|nr:hypothetical protein [Opitutales bacterium]
MADALNERRQFTRQIIREQIPFFQKNFSHVKSYWKEDCSRVTAADLALSKTIAKSVLTAFPQDDFCSEEDLPAAGTSRKFSAPFAWVLDPIDGTNNFARGMPQCAISLAILQNGVPVYGIVYDNAQNQILEGGNDIGLLKNGAPFVPEPAQAYDERSILSMHFPVPAKILSALEPLLTVNPFRCQGSAALNLAYNAFGAIDGSIDFKTRIWDIAAAYAMLIASGRTIRFVKNNPFPLKKIEHTMPEIQWFAGTPSFMEKMETINF